MKQRDAAGAENTVLRDLLMILQAKLAAGCPTSVLRGESLCTRVAAELLRYSVEQIRLDHYKGGLSKPQLRHVLEYVESFLDQNLAVEDLAHVAGLSRYHFGKAFKQSTGINLHEYVLSRRIQRARDLLSKPEYPLADIAVTTGFSNQSHFTTVFKSEIGVTPGAYRNRHRRT